MNKYLLQRAQIKIKIFAFLCELRGSIELNHNAALSDGAGGALWLPFYCLRRDATALGLLLLSMLDITSSFH
jgi:hypothetical protein